MNAAAPDLDPALRQREVGSFAIDSRECSSGDVFFALSQPDYRNNGFNGDFEDSTRFVPDAFEKGASACVVRADRFDEHKAILEKFRDRLIFVDDAIAAFQRLARGVYLDWNKPGIIYKGQTNWKNQFSESGKCKQHYNNRNLYRGKSTYLVQFIRKRNGNI